MRAAGSLGGSQAAHGEPSLLVSSSWHCSVRVSAAGAAGHVRVHGGPLGCQLGANWVPGCDRGATGAARPAGLTRRALCLWGRRVSLSGPRQGALQPLVAGTAHPPPPHKVVSYYRPL